MRRFLLLAAALTGCYAPVVSGINRVNGCAFDAECPTGYHCDTGACQLLPRTCQIDETCDPGQSCQNGNCLPANHQFCEPCETQADCAIGALCVGVEGETGYCTTACSACESVKGVCAAATDALGSDAGQTCFPVGGVCPGGDGGVTAVTFTFVNQNLIQAEGCTVCHSADAGIAYASLDLVTDPYHALVGVTAKNLYGSVTTQADGGPLLLVSPGDATESVLYIKLGLTQNSTLYGEPMPTATPGLTPPSMISAVQQWISGGAPNN